MMPTEKEIRVHKLALEILSLADKPQDYYFLNVNKPLMAELFKRYKLRHAISTIVPSSDLERIEFELMLLSESFLRVLEEKLNQIMGC